MVIYTIVINKNKMKKTKNNLGKIVVGIVAAAAIVAVAGLATNSNALQGDTVKSSLVAGIERPGPFDNGNPFGLIWDAIEDLQGQIQSGGFSSNKVYCYHNSPHNTTVESTPVTPDDMNYNCNISTTGGDVFGNFCFNYSNNNLNNNWMKMHIYIDGNEITESPQPNSIKIIGYDNNLYLNSNFCGMFLIENIDSGMHSIELKPQYYPCGPITESPQCVYITNMRSIDLEEREPQD